MHTRTFKAVVFDMDGVIFDSERLVQFCWAAVAEKHGIPDIEQACTECLGLDQRTTIEHFKLRYGNDFKYAEYKEEMRELYKAEFYRDTAPLKPGIERLLEVLKRKGIKTAVASSTRREVVEKELSFADLLKYFDAVVCGDMVSKSKPDPEIFLKAFEELGVNPKDAYVIEDSFNGIHAGYASGARVIMVPDMVQPDDNIRFELEVCLHTLSDVEKYIFS